MTNLYRVLGFDEEKEVPFGKEAINGVIINVEAEEEKEAITKAKKLIKRKTYVVKEISTQMDNPLAERGLELNKDQFALNKEIHANNAEMKETVSRFADAIEKLADIIEKEGI